MANELYKVAGLAVDNPTTDNVTSRVLETLAYLKEIGGTDEMAFMFLELDPSLMMVSSMAVDATVTFRSPRVAAIMMWSVIMNQVIHKARGMVRQ